MKRHLLALLHRTRGGHMFHEVQKRINGLQESPTMSDQEMQQWYRFIQNAIEEAKMSGRNNPRGYPRFAKRVANRFLEANSRSLLTEGDEGFRYVGSDIYNVRDMAKHWAKGKPFHFIKEMPNGKMEEQELIFQAFPSKGVLEVHIKGITHSDESDGNFITHHGQTYYSSHSVSSVDELNAFTKSFKPKPSQMKSLYYQIIENDGGWMG